MDGTKKLTGIVKGEIIEVRPAYSGKVAKIYQKTGNVIEQGDWLLSLERKEMQINLDKELADYEKIRAEFEIFILDNPNPGTEKIKYEKIQVQAMLNAAVKAVESAKYRLDEADLKSPVKGQIISDGRIRAGMYITPGSYYFQILDQESIYVSVGIEDRDIWPKLDQEVTVKTGERENIGKISAIIPSLKEITEVRIKVPETLPLIIGSKVEVRI